MLLDHYVNYCGLRPYNLPENKDKCPGVNKPKNLFLKMRRF